MIQPIQWSSSFLVGIEVIDEQHQHMISIINALFQELETRIGDIDIQEFFTDAVNYGDYHFQTEETYFSHRDYPEQEQHLLAHQGYKKTLHELLESTGDSHQKASDLLDFLEDWWVSHITGIDQTLASLKK